MDERISEGPLLRPAAQQRAETLAAELTTLCAHRYALEAKFLDLLREFDTGQYWERLGFGSCAHWLNLKCSIGLNAAREKLRVAHALAELPKVAQAFAEGRLSYSKVRAMTRIADERNEDYLLMIATHGTAYHVETLVRKYRRARRLQDVQRTQDTLAARSLSWQYDEDGMLLLKARLPAEQGALVIEALEQALARAEADGQSADPVPAALAVREVGIADVTAETSALEPGGDVTAETPVREPKHARRADGLVALAETYLANPGCGSSSADRFRVVVHVSAETLHGRRHDEHFSDVTAETSHESIDCHVTAETSGEIHGSHVTAETSSGHCCRPGELSHLEHGPWLPAETSRRLCCDAALVALLEDAHGIPLSVGRQTRSIPPFLRRALFARDGGCRFPGCTHTRFVDGHHILHWSRGGETSLDNLVLLCRHHHRLVHEGGFGCERTASGEIIFTTPDRQLLSPYEPLPGIDSGEDPLEWLARQVDTKHIDADTCTTKWYAGDRMDWDLAVSHLF